MSLLAFSNEQSARELLPPRMGCVRRRPALCSTPVLAAASADGRPARGDPRLAAQVTNAASGLFSLSPRGDFQTHAHPNPQHTPVVTSRSFECARILPTRPTNSTGQFNKTHVPNAVRQRICSCRARCAQC
eukprot:3574105-Pleurochrysis_carterae.AAC.2